MTSLSAASSSSDDDARDEEVAWEEWGDGGGDDSLQSSMVRCLFCPTTEATTRAVLVHMTDVHAFDYGEVCRSMRLDFYDRIRMVNYIRGDQVSAADCLARLQSDGKALFGDDKHMRPVLADDALLMIDDDEEDDDDDEEDKDKEEKVEARSVTATTDGKVSLLTNENAALKATVVELQESLAMMRNTLHTVVFPAAAATATTTTTTTTPPSSSSTRGVDKVDRDYFSGYSERYIHEVMLRDRVRTEAYRDFMDRHAAQMAGKVVLDVGCGTGILSMFAARAGARAVIAIDAADIVHKTREIVALNGFAGRVHVIRGKVEEVELPAPYTHVDVIISEWMGYFLLFESMLPSVISARDRWLAPDGVMAPARARMYIQGLDGTVDADARHFWTDVYGFNMTPMVTEEEKFGGGGSGDGGIGGGVGSRVVAETVDHVCTRTHAEATPFVDLDIATVRASDLDFTVPFEVVATRDTTLRAWCVSFDTLFSWPTDTTSDGGGDVVLSTRVEDPCTHWKQTVFHMAVPMTVKAGDRVHGTMRASRPASNAREYEVFMSWRRHGDNNDGGDGGDAATMCTQTFSLRVSDE